MPVIDLETLLAPCIGINPAGRDISYEPVFDEIKEARRGEMEHLPQGEWKTKIKVADWEKAKNLAIEVITSHSKDLQVAVWLVEALGHRHGFAGVADGLMLLDGLLVKFWDSLYPEITDADLDWRIGRLVWLDDNLPLSLRMLPITAPNEVSEGYGWAHWQESRSVDNLGRQSEAQFKQALEDGKVDSERWEAAVHGTSAAFYQALLADSSAALVAAQTLSTTVDKQFGRDAPGLLNITEALNDVVKLASKLAHDKGAAPRGLVELNADLVETGSGERAAGSLAAKAADSGPPRTREDALVRLQEIADFYRKSEPHSPVTYLIEKAARWGGMRLDEWIREVVADENTRSHLKDMLCYSDD